MQSLPRLVSSWAFGLAIAFTANLLPSALAAQRSEREVLEDLQFASGLARNWEFTDLASEVLTRVEKAGIPSALRPDFELTRCEVLAMDARGAADPLRRRDQYRLALQGYSDFLGGEAPAALRARAQANYVDVASEFGRAMELQLEELAGEPAKELRREVTKLLSTAVKDTRGLVDAIRSKGELTELEKRELGKLELNRGRMNFQMARIAEDPSFLLEEAFSILEQLTLELGERSAIGLQAFLEMAKIRAFQSRWRDAFDYAEFVVNTTIPRDPEQWAEAKKNMSPEAREQAWLYVQLAIPQLLESQMNAGRPAEACDWGLHFYNTWKREGFNLNLPLGHLAMLSFARTLLDAGGYVGGSLSGGNLRWFSTPDEMEKAGVTSRRDQRNAIDLALSIADFVNQDQKGTTLQVRAQKLISEAITRPGVVVAPSVLFEAAQGPFNSRDYANAVRGFKRVLAALEGADNAAKSEFGPKTMYFLGRSFQLSGRPLEAAMAFREGVTTWVGDPKYDADNAKGYKSAADEISRLSSGDPAIQTLVGEAERKVQEFATASAGDIFFSNGKKSYDAKDYIGAIGHFAQVPQGAENYEKAVAYTSAAHYRNKDYALARSTAEEYLLRYVKNPANAPDSDLKRARRLEASAMATYYLGLVVYRDAEQGNAKYEQVVELLSRFPSQFPGQTSLGPNAMSTAALAQLKLNDIEGAEATLNTMLADADYAKDKATANTALKLYQYLKPIEDAAAAAGDEPKAEELRTRMARYMQKFNQLSETPALSSLRIEAALWAELEQWATMESVLQSAVARYSKDPAAAEDLERSVVPDLGEALVQQRKLREALTVLAPLVPGSEDQDTKLKPTSQTVQDYCRSVLGWVEAGASGSFTVVPGVGTKEDIENASRWWLKLTNGTPDDQKWSCRWYELKFQTAYGFLIMARQDSAKKETARSQVKQLTGELGDNFEGKAGVPGMKESCGGNDELRQRYLWLVRELAKL